MASTRRNTATGKRPGGGAPFVPSIIARMPMRKIAVARNSSKKAPRFVM
jgi:hypothetical protein